MLSKKVLFFMIVAICVMSLNITFAASVSRLTRDDLIAVLKNQEKNSNDSNEIIRQTSGENIASGEVNADLSGEKLTSGELIEFESGDTLASGELTKEESKEMQVSGEIVDQASGEKLDSGEVIDELSGEALFSGELKDETSGEVLNKLSGDEHTSGETAIDEMVSGEINSGESTQSAEIVEVKANDVEEFRWYSKYVNDVLSRGIMELDEEGNFNPTNKVTKGDVVNAIYNLPGRNLGEEKEWAIEKGIVDGKDNLNAEAKREDVAVVIYNYVKSQGGGFKGTWKFILGYEDREEISEDAYEAVAWCIMNDILIGKTDETINSQDVAIRAELATIIYRLSTIY